MKSEDGASHGRDFRVVVVLELVSQEKCGVIGADVQGGREIGKVGFGAAQVRT